jgi:hypothetical protein
MVPDYEVCLNVIIPRLQAEQALIVRDTSTKSDALAPVVQVVWADLETGVEAAVGQVGEWDPVRGPGGEKRIDMVT